MSQRLQWGTGALSIEFAWSTNDAPRIASIAAGAHVLTMPAGLPLIEILTVSQGHALANDRLVHTSVGHDMRYRSHQESADERSRTLKLTVAHQLTGLLATITLTLFDDVAAIHSTVTVTNQGEQSIILRSVPSFSVYLGGDGDCDIRQWSVHHALSDWLGEGRWIRESLDSVRFPRLEQHRTSHNPRGAFSVVSTGTWSTGKHLPVAAVSSRQRGAAWAWQIEHNGPWRWEVGEDTRSGYLALSGPTDMDHQWVRVLAPSEEFETVPATVALASDFTEAIGELTRYRRTARRNHPDNAQMSVVFNDYMNTLNGNPTTEKLLPLIDAAAEVGVEIFCIDAGWYDDSGEWWDTVGEWKPSTTRFPGGLAEVTDHIRAAGMVPGLWLEPESVGVRSPMADRLPFDSFLQRKGQRVVEQNRYHLDLRHPATRSHLDEVVDRLVREFGIGFIKLDYNINPGAGTDHAADSVGDGLLEHNRAHLDWVDSVLARHPTLVLENCGSGAMRADFGILSRMQMQSTSDQQDFLKYPPIAAAAPASMLPEQAANWAYPQPTMTEEEIAFCLSTGLLGRFYLSGYLNHMTPAQRALVGEAVEFAKSVATELTESTPFWPLGIPTWDGSWTALGLRTSTSALVAVWNRTPDDDTATLDLGSLGGQEYCARAAFPIGLREWTTQLDQKTGMLRVHNPTGEVGARIFRLEASHLVSDDLISARRADVPIRADHDGSD